MCASGSPVERRLLTLFRDPDPGTLSLFGASMVSLCRRYPALLGCAAQSSENSKSGDRNGKATLHDRLLARFDLHRLGVDLPDSRGFWALSTLLGLLMAALAFPPRV